MKIIFLDIDGVLCVDWNLDVDEFGHPFRKEYVTNLNQIIQATGAKIVISSSWRKSGLSEMKRMWKDRNLPGEVIDITPSLWTIRGEEIEEYLRENPCDTYVIIDDETDFLPEQMKCFIRTSKNNHFEAHRGLGLTQRCAKQAIRVLNTKF
jgi:hypothetical protein